MTDCNTPYRLWKVTGWNAIDSLGATGTPFSYCNNLVPNQFNTVYQLPRTGNTFIGGTFYWPTPSSDFRIYLKNRLKDKLKAGKVYCAKFYVNIMNMSSCGNDGFGMYFGDNSVNTITNTTAPLSYLNPQVKCQTGVPIKDTLGWTLVSGTFTATGNEKFAIIGVFPQSSMIDTVMVNDTVVQPFFIFTDACIDDVSCIELDLPAYTGPDKFIYAGDSVYIGRQPDYIIDTGCVWYRLPNTITALDTASGIWVKPTTTSTYVVRQQLDCSPIKWDTVVVSFKIPVDTNDVGLDKLNWLSDNTTLFPNPTSGNLNISLPSSVSADFNTFSITNNLGQIVRQEDVAFSTNSADIGTSDLAPGLYQLHFTTKYGALTKKFVKTGD